MKKRLEIDAATLQQQENPLQFVKDTADQIGMDYGIGPICMEHGVHMVGGDLEELFKGEKSSFAGYSKKYAAKWDNIFGAN